MTMPMPSSLYASTSTDERTKICQDDIEQKTKKFAICKLVEGTWTMLMCTLFFVFLGDMRKDMGSKKAGVEDNFWKLSQGEQRLYASCLLFYSVCSLLAGFISLVGVVKMRSTHFRLVFIIQVSSVIFSIVLLILTLYFVGATSKLLLAMIGLAYIPFNCYLTYIIRCCLEVLKSQEEQMASNRTAYKEAEQMMHSNHAKNQSQQPNSGGGGQSGHQGQNNGRDRAQAQMNHMNHMNHMTTHEPYPDSYYKEVSFDMPPPHQHQQHQQGGHGGFGLPAPARPYHNA